MKTETIEAMVIEFNIFKAEVYRIIRNNQHKGSKAILDTLRQHFPDKSTDYLMSAINSLEKEFN